MATTSTLVTAKNALVTQLKAALPNVQVTYAWPGPAAKHECIFMGRHPVTDENTIRVSSNIPSIKAGRKLRQETYILPVTIWVYGGEYTAAEAETVESRGLELFEELQDILADTPQFTTAIQYAELEDYDVDLRAYEQGWLSYIVAEVRINARLT